MSASLASAKAPAHAGRVEVAFALVEVAVSAFENSVPIFALNSFIALTIYGVNPA